MCIVYELQQKILMRINKLCDTCYFTRITRPTYMAYPLCIKMRLVGELVFGQPD